MPGSRPGLDKYLRSIFGDPPHMAAGTFTLTNAAKKKLLDGTFDLDTHTFKACLLTAAVPLTAASAPANYGAITSQVTGTGYTVGGQALASVTLVESTGTVVFDAADVSWAASTITAKWIVIYDDSAASKDVVGFMDLDNTSGSTTVSSASGALTVQWYSTGLFAIA